MSLGRVMPTLVGSGAGPIGSLTVVPTLGSFWARAAKPAAPRPAPTTTPSAILIMECMFFSPGIDGEDDRRELRWAATRCFRTSLLPPLPRGPAASTIKNLPPPLTPNHQSPPP